MEVCLHIFPFRGGRGGGSGGADGTRVAWAAPAPRLHKPASNPPPPHDLVRTPPPYMGSAHRSLVHPLLRILGIFFVFCAAAVAWIVLGGVTTSRTGGQEAALEGRVADLWGSPQTQAAPTFAEEWWEDVVTQERVTDARGAVSLVDRTVRQARSQAVDPSKTRADVTLSLDQRRKGLLWYPLYDVTFDGEWTYVHSGVPRYVRATFAFPDRQAPYDNLRFVIDGVDRAGELRPENGTLTWQLWMEPGETLVLGVGYKSRGMREWVYRPTPDVGRIDDFALTMHTDFDTIDYPTLTMSPSTRTATADGWTLEWTFDRLVSSYGVGMVMPERIQPGELAAGMAFSAPLSLGLFFLWIYALGLLRRIEIHPVNYLFLAGAFFAFDLLFAYTADHLTVEWAFALASVVSVGLVVSYLRLVVGARFAFVEAGLAQVLYQIGFAAAHFQEGLTGLTITVLSIVTLFALMQLTGRIQWSAVMRGEHAQA